MLLTAVRRAGDQLVSALHQVHARVSPAELERWKLAVGRAMGALSLELLEPICQENPAVVPKALGGDAPD